MSLLSSTTWTCHRCQRSTAVYTPTFVTSASTTCGLCTIACTSRTQNSATRSGRRFPWGGSRCSGMTTACVTCRHSRAFIPQRVPMNGLMILTRTIPSICRPSRVSTRLNFSLPYGSPANSAPLVDARVVRINSVCAVPVFAKAQSVDLSNGRIDLHHLAGVPCVRLMACKTTQDAEIVDLSPLRQARFVELHNMERVMHLRCLESVREVVIDGCSSITTFPPATHLRAFTWHNSTLMAIPPELGGVRFLDLSMSIDLEDVSAARNVHELILRKCFALKDVSALGSVHTLRITHLRGTVDVSALGGVHTLDLCRVRLRGVARLAGVHHLMLADAEFNTEDVSKLGTVHTLHFE
eukprot:Opistho-2@14545